MQVTILDLNSNFGPEWLREDLDNPVHVRMTTGTALKWPKQDSLTEALTSVATVFAKMIDTPSTTK